MEFLLGLYFFIVCCAGGSYVVHLLDIDSPGLVYAFVGIMSLFISVASVVIMDFDITDEKKKNLKILMIMGAMTLVLLSILLIKVIFFG